MELHDVVLKPETITGNAGGKNITIERSISFLYIRQEFNDGNYDNVSYDALTWRHTEQYTLVEKLLFGYPLTALEWAKLNNVLVRYGWLCSNAHQLHFYPIAEIVDKFIYGTQDDTDRNKFIAICRQLGISMRKMSPRKLVEPKKKDKDAEYTISTVTEPPVELAEYTHSLLTGDPIPQYAH